MIKGTYVGLRAVEESDLKTLLDWRNNPKFRKFFREYRELNYYQQFQWFKNKVNADNCTSMFSIIDLDRNNLVGVCGLCYINWINRSADLSIYIGKDDLYIDSKYALDSANALINYGFKELNLHRIWTEIYSFDLQKIKFLEAIGFSLEGRHRQTYYYDGEWLDSLFYGLLSTDLSCN